jgi:hypothetical protein
MGKLGGVQFRVKFRVRFRVPGSAVRGSGFKVQGSGSGFRFRVQGSGLGFPKFFIIFLSSIIPNQPDMKGARLGVERCSGGSAPGGRAFHAHTYREGVRLGVER